MPLPIAPLLLRIGVAAAAGYGLARWVSARAGHGRADQRAEDALDDLDEGLFLRQAGEGAPGPATPAQHNATLRFRRVVGFRGREWEVDAGLIARLRLRERVKGGEA